MLSDGSQKPVIENNEETRKTHHLNILEKLLSIDCLCSLYNYNIFSGRLCEMGS